MASTIQIISDKPEDDKYYVKAILHQQALNQSSETSNLEFAYYDIIPFENPKGLTYFDELYAMVNYYRISAGTPVTPEAFQAAVNLKGTYNQKNALSQAVQHELEDKKIIDKILKGKEGV